MTTMTRMTRAWLGLALVLGGCTELTQGPRLAADAATLDREDATPDMLPEGMTDRPDMADAEAAVDADVPPADVPPDVMTDVIPDDVRDGGTDVPATGGPRLVGGFVSSAVPTSASGRLTGGFVWQGSPGAGSRLEGWLR